jgi:hypothetical protein
MTSAPVLVRQPTKRGFYSLRQPRQSGLKSLKETLGARKRKGLVIIRVISRWARHNVMTSRCHFQGGLNLEDGS